MKQLLLLLCALRLASLCRAEVFSLPDSGVSFDAPMRFTRLSSQEISKKFPSDRSPAFVVGNDDRTTTIAYDLKANSIAPDKLDETLTSLASAFKQIVPNLKWIARKIIKLQGQRWIYLEMTSVAEGNDIHNVMLLTPYNGKMLMFNFNSTREEFPAMETELRKSIASITLKRQ
jgi:hypothetical protein